MDSPIPVQNRFCVKWSAQLFEKTNFSVVTAPFTFRNEQYYFKLNYTTSKISSDHQNFELVLFRSDGVKTNGESSPFGMLCITALLENVFDDDVGFSNVGYFPLSTNQVIFSVPSVICSFTTCDYDESIGCNNDYFELVKTDDGLRHDADFVCYLENLDKSPPPQIHDNQETGELSTVINLSSGLEGLSLDLGNLLKNGTLPDIRLNCGKDCTVPAHKALLAARSEVFAAMFISNMKESQTDVVDLGDVKQDVVDAFLQYVYTGKFPADLLDDTVMGLYAMADKYAVHALMDCCRDQMVNNLSEENYIDYLAVADAHSDNVFKHTVISFICRKEEILRGKTWLEFVKNPSPLAMEVYQSFVERKAKTSE